MEKNDFKDALRNRPVGEIMADLYTLLTAYFGVNHILQYHPKLEDEVEFQNSFVDLIMEIGEKSLLLAGKIIVPEDKIDEMDGAVRVLNMFLNNTFKNKN